MVFLNLTLGKLTPKGGYHMPETGSQPSEKEPGGQPYPLNYLSLDVIRTKTYNLANMTSEEMERAIEFLLDHHARVSADIERHSEQIGQLTENVEAMRVEMRDAINNLIVANEVTRDLAEQTARLAIQTSQRVTDLGSKQ